MTFRYSIYNPKRNHSYRLLYDTSDYNHLCMYLLGRFEQAVESASETGVTSTRILHSKQSVYSMHDIMHADTLLVMVHEVETRVARL